MNTYPLDGYVSRKGSVYVLNNVFIDIDTKDVYAYNCINYYKYSKIVHHSYEVYIISDI